MEHISLNNGVEMPILGYGTYQTPSRITEQCVLDALHVGYRSIDTAQCYGNEHEVGLACRKSGIPQSELFITTKLWACHGYQDTMHSIDSSLKKIGMGYIDLLLIHEPTGNVYEIYRAIPNAPENMFILPDTQEAIVPQAQWDRVQELRKNKRRITKGERQGLFSGLAFCADCSGKLHFGTCKSFEGHQDRYACSHYKSGRGTCSAHYIREEVLRDVVLERIQAVTEYIRQDVNGFQEEWLRCCREDQEKAIKDDKRQLAKAKKRLADLDVLMTKIYEDMVLGDLSRECYQKVTESYEAEQERLKLEIAVTEEWVEQREEMSDNLYHFFALTEKYVDIPELTPTIVNEFIKKIIIYAPGKSSGKRTQEIRIIFNFLDEVELPEVNGSVIVAQTKKCRKTA